MRVGTCAYPVKDIQSYRKASVASAIGFGSQLTKCGRLMSQQWGSPPPPPPILFTCVPFSDFNSTVLPLQKACTAAISSSALIWSCFSQTAAAEIPDAICSRAHLGGICLYLHLWSCMLNGSSIPIPQVGDLPL